MYEPRLRGSPAVLSWSIPFLTGHWLSGQGRNFRFSTQQCAGCPLAAACRGADVPPEHLRQVFISDFRSTVWVMSGAPASFDYGQKRRGLHSREACLRLTDCTSLVNWPE